MPSKGKKQLKEMSCFFIGAGERIRTAITTLEGLGNSHYTTPA
jgi:hypothetical protein